MNNEHTYRTKVISLGLTQACYNSIDYFLSKLYRLQQQYQPAPTHYVSVQPKTVVYQIEYMPPEFEPPDYLALVLLVCMVCGCLNVTSLLLSITALILSSMVSYKYV